MNNLTKTKYSYKIAKNSLYQKIITILVLIIIAIFAGNNLINAYIYSSESNTLKVILSLLFIFSFLIILFFLVLDLYYNFENITVTMDSIQFENYFFKSKIEFDDIKKITNYQLGLKIHYNKKIKKIRLAFLPDSDAEQLSKIINDIEFDQGRATITD